MSENTENNETWAVVELMGHVTIAGRITKPGEYGGLWMIDIPEDEGFHTEFFGSQSVYRVRIVSEEIARAYARPSHEIIEYDAPIVPRAEYENALRQLRSEIERLLHKNQVLSDRLTQVNSLPEPSQPEKDPYYDLDPEHEWDQEEYEREAGEE